MPLIRKLLRYASVSAIATAVSLTILGGLIAANVTSAGWANVIATAAGTIPSFELNRRWVWRKSGPRSIVAEVGPFVALSLGGLGLSTIAVSAGAGWASSTGMGHSARALAAEAANIATFGSLWVVQYLILDRILFGQRRHRIREAA
jgi:putative flippase GtrA